MEEGGWADFSGITPSGQLLDQVAALNIDDADLMQTLDAIVGLEKIVAMAQGWQQQLIARFAAIRAREQHHIAELDADELGAALTISRHAAAFRLELADELTHRLPGALAALRHGAIDLRKATVLAELTSVLSAEHAAQVEAAVLPRAGRQTAPIFRQAVRRAILRIDPEGSRERHQERRRGRGVELRPVDDGMAWLNAYLPYEQAAAIYERVDSLAERAATPDDERTANARRADALVDLILNPTGDGPPRYEVRITIPASTLLGLDERPAELDGYGPIPAEVARDLAGDARWRRLLTDPLDGTLLDYGRRTYRPPDGLADHVRARDKTCRFPGCRHPAGKCDLDHRTPFPDGPTSDSNLISLCRHHHRLKTESNWLVASDNKGNVAWEKPHRTLLPRTRRTSRLRACF